MPGARLHGAHIDASMPVRLCRERVDPRVDAYVIRTAGYADAPIPECGHRASVPYGWTGEEPVLARAMSAIWDEAGREGA